MVHTARVWNRFCAGLGTAVVLVGAACLPSLAEEKMTVNGIVPFWLNGGVYECKKATGPIKLDGKLDEADWARAGQIPLVTSPAGETPHTATVGRLLYDENYLYWSAVIADHDLEAVSVGHDPAFGEDDVIELFVKPDSQDPKYWPLGYWEFHITPLRATRDYFWVRRFSMPEKNALAGESGMQFGIQIDGTVNYWEDKDKGYTVEAAIPIAAFSKLARKPVSGDKWKFLFARYDYSVYDQEGIEYSTSAKMSAVNYHLYEEYPYMVFGK